MVQFRELSGSPVESYNRDGFVSATRVFIVPWAQRLEFVELAIGNENQLGVGYPGVANTMVDAVKIKPFTEAQAKQVMSDLGEDLASYDGYAEITLEYKPCPRPDGESEQPNNPPPIEPTTFLTYSQTTAGEMLELPARGLRFRNEYYGGEKIPMPHDYQFYKRVATIEHHLTWHRVIAPPWDAIRNCLGKLHDVRNSGYQFLGAPDDCLLFDSANVETEFAAYPGGMIATNFWVCKYTFKERTLQWGNSMVGWNKYWRQSPPESPGWDEILDQNGNPVWQYADFRTLFQFAPNSKK